jgi:hypothetical protein
MTWIGANANGAGVLEIDLVFPRANETYAPTPTMPFVFALRNAELAQWPLPTIGYWFEKWDDPRWWLRRHVVPLMHKPSTRTDWSGHEPYFKYHVLNNFTIEDDWKLYWVVKWQGCNVSDSGQFQRLQAGESDTMTIDFHTRIGGKEVDLVAATANDTTCPT